MNFNQYQQHALNTCNVHEKQIFNSIHMVLGITDEYFEVLEAYAKSIDESSIKSQIDGTQDLKKELGDVLWYTALLAYFNNLDFSRGSEFRKVNIETAIRTVNSVFKANWIYDRSMITPDKTAVPPIDQIQEAIYNIVYWIETEFPFKIEEIMELNIEKLSKRFPNKFEKHLANNRKPEDN